ncbi:uncharacterized protein I206_103678 [Kwoniella pini CBS 10737]|uniref:F-box domain-containing protein n=1 Tax=Kwoniella pini CBS 10737 TaxID=1296096 RepID=A0A1B9I8Y5_9TREE|nr:uncharacterized protein I206_01322 [Kwoniella pini CBS 10737]OCF52038.1 hypothetical protein I206_01322 [Kwoniella pini CBS 10737]
MSSREINPAPASSLLGSTSDIISHICSYLPPSSLYSTLQVSKSFFHASVPHLYHSIHVGRNSGNIFIGSKRSDNLSFDTIPHRNTDSTSFFDEINKNSLLKHIKRIEVSIHLINECPFVKQFIEPLSNLEIVHLSRKGQDGNMENNTICFNEKCQFITKVCNRASKVIIRQLDMKPLKSFSKLQEVTIKIRPCELPWYRDDKFSEELFLNELNNLPGSVKKLDLVWWDESHKYIEEAYEVPRSHGWDNLNRISSKNVMRLIRGCTYCDQEGCVRYRPHVGVQLPYMFKILGSKTNIEQIRIWNFEYTVKRSQWMKSAIQYEDLKELMINSFNQGRESRISKSDLESSQSVNTAETTKITFHSGLEYYHTFLSSLEGGRSGEGSIQVGISKDDLEYWRREVPPEEFANLRIRK